MRSMHRLPLSPSRGMRRNRVFLAAGFCCALIVVWVAYEFGQIRAGHNGFEARKRQSELQGRIGEVRAENDELRRQVAILETGKKIDIEAYRQVEQRLAELQNEILTQQEDLAFYRGIVADQQTGLRVQDLELLAGADDYSFSLRLVLAQAMRASQRISGSVRLQVEGMRNGQALTLGLPELGVVDEQRRSLSGFSFRYFQNLEADLVLPEGFAPARVIVTLTPKGKQAKPVEKVFAWAVRPG